MDLSSAFNAVMQAVNGAFEWFARLPEELTYLLVGLTLFVFFCRLIIAPMFGSGFSRGGSDSVNRGKGESE